MHIVSFQVDRHVPEKVDCHIGCMNETLMSMHVPNKQ